MTKLKAKSAPIANPTVGDLIIHYLKLEGVTHVFGIPGGGLMRLLVELKDNHEDIDYIICRQETGAAYMADGYFRATGKIGVVVVTTGPGATNAVTGVMNAQADGSSLLLLTGEIDQKYDGMGYLQEGVDSTLNLDDIFKAATTYSVMMESGADANTLMKQALRNITSTPHQAAHISLPVNVTAEPIPSASDLATNINQYRTGFHCISPGETRKALQSLLACQKPLLFVGNGCREALSGNAYNDLLLFAETYAIPIMTTADAKGIFPETHELSLRVFGMADCMWPYHYLKGEDGDLYDGLMVIGSQLGELSTNKWSDILIPSGENAPFIQVDANQRMIARSYPVTQGIVSDAGAFMHELAEFIPEFPVDQESINQRRQKISKIKSENSPFFDPKSYASEESPIQPAAMMRVLQETMPKNTKIFIDAGNCVGWSVHYLAIDAPSSIFTSLSMGPMGFAVGAVVGAKIGCPEDTCIGFTGDGAFMMQGSEISTARQNNVGAIWIVLSDNNLSMVSQGMSHFFHDDKDPDIWHELYELGNPDLQKYAESLGAEAYTIDSPADFSKIMPTVLDRANKHNVPQVIVANINREAIPPYYNPMYPPKK